MLHMKPIERRDLINNKFVNVILDFVAAVIRDIYIYPIIPDDNSVYAFKMSLVYSLRLTTFLYKYKSF